MKKILQLLALILNSLPKTDFILVHWCHIYRRYGLVPPNMVGMDSAPSVSSTSPATNIASTTVTASGNITATGGQTPTIRGVCYVAGTGTPTTENTVNSESGSFGTGAFSRNLTGLSSGTLYTFRAFATNSVGTGYGNNVQFTTTAVPTVTTQAVSSIGSTTATGNGNVTADNGATITERGVCWNTSTNPTTANSKGAAAGTTGAYTVPMSSLSVSTHYYVRAYAINSVGTSYGDNVEFDTTATFTASPMMHMMAQSGGLL